MAASNPFHVAIVGGGLCGIALGIALKKRNVSFTLYESRGSFTEIGAGINLGPSAMRSLRIIEPLLDEKIRKLTTRNPPPHEDTWMILRYGAASGAHKDGEIIHEFKIPGIGNVSLHRQELLATLAEEMGSEHARFNKSLVTYEQDIHNVQLTFKDGSVETASVLVGCDGIHSKVRSHLVGANSPVSKPVFGESGVYRAVVPMEKAVEAIGQSARCSTVRLGPNCYFISYPVDKGTKLNCGAWLYLPGQPWDHKEWVIPDHGKELRKNYQGFGEHVQKLLNLFDPNPSFWAAFEHKWQPENFVDRRVIVIGDGAHSMPPHQGSGAATAVEDACVLAEVLACIDANDRSTATATAALKAVEQIRKPRFLQVQRYSSEAGPRWHKFYEQKLEDEELAKWIGTTEERLRWIWDIDIESQAEEAKALFEKLRSAS